MATATILYCVSDDLLALPLNLGVGLDYMGVGCYDGVSALVPVELTIEQYCEIHDCSTVQATTINSETLEAYWPFALLMFAIAFGFRSIRKLIYSKA